MSGFRWNFTITTTNTGKSRFAGNAARNCATGWIFSARRRAQPDQHADRHPDHRGDRDQHHHAQQRDEPEHEHAPDLAPRDARHDERRRRVPDHDNAVRTSTTVAHTMSPAAPGDGALRQRKARACSAGSPSGTRAAFAKSQPSRHQQPVNQARAANQIEQPRRRRVAGTRWFPCGTCPPTRPAGGTSADRRRESRRSSSE